MTAFTTGENVQPVERADATGMRAYADELRRTFMSLQDEGLDLLRNAKAVQVTERSKDGLITVTVNSRGELVRLDIDPRIYRHPDARALADTITDTVHRAGEKAQQKVVEVFEPLVPADQMRAYIEGDVEKMMDQLAGMMAGRTSGDL
ncbi:YbaB/EbfC family nucleoid-associated protein [Streptosporangium jomthongense]|uniref:YbaB/EbfC family nucleoid-associated protein n=1 Tax=Streptosporangium jomthongense TaxID=1193683 RepID=A0ABV8F635_9ACTN